MPDSISSSKLICIEVPIRYLCKRLNTLYYVKLEKIIMKCQIHLNPVQNMSDCGHTYATLYTKQTLSLPCFSSKISVKNVRKWTHFSDNTNGAFTLYSSRAFICMVTPLGFVWQIRIGNFRLLVKEPGSERVKRQVRWVCCDTTMWRESRAQSFQLHCVQI